MSDWLRGECLFDPSPEDIARYGLRNYIPEDEKVLWIGRPTWASYVLLKSKFRILFLITISMLSLFYQINIRQIYFVNFFLISCFLVFIGLGSHRNSHLLLYFIKPHWARQKKKAFFVRAFPYSPEQTNLKIRLWNSGQK